MDDYIKSVWKKVQSTLDKKFQYIPDDCLIIRELEDEAFLVFDTKINMIVRTMNKYERGVNHK